MVEVNEVLEAFLVEMRARMDRLEENLRPTATCFKIEKAAEMIGISPSKLKSMLRKGQIRPSQVGDTRMISMSEILRVTAPEAEKPKVERRQREARWVPIRQR